MNIPYRIIICIVILAPFLASFLYAQIPSATPNKYEETLSKPKFLSTHTRPVSSTDTVYYEDFNDGLDGWTIVNTNPDSVRIWKYETNPDYNLPTGRDRWPIFDSPSVTNGFLLYDYGNYIVDSMIPIVGPPYPHLIGSAESPFLDWSALDITLDFVLNFFSLQPTLFNSNSRVEVRRRGLTDAVVWNAKDCLDRPNTAQQLSPICNIPNRFIGQDSVQIVFVYDGDFYGWFVDDILVLPRPEIEVALSSFIAPTANSVAPAVYAAKTPMTLAADVLNNGSETLDLELVINIADSIGALVYTDSLILNEIRADSFMRNQALPPTPMPTSIGKYTVVYELLTDRIQEDVIPLNNVRSFTFEVSQASFSKGNTNLRSIECCANNAEFHSTNIYYTPERPIYHDVYIENLSFALAYQSFFNDDEGFVEVKVFGFRGDLNSDGIPSYGEQENPTAELVELSIQEFIIDTSSQSIPNFQVTTLTPSSNGRIFVPHEYIGFAIEIAYYNNEGGTNDDNRFALYGKNESCSEILYSVDSTLNAGINHIIQVPSLGINAYGYLDEKVPFIDATISIDSLTNTITPQLNHTEFAVRPNPATTTFTIDFDFETSVDAQFEIINAVANTVSAFNRVGLTSGAITIPTQGMNNGLYYVKVRTDDGQTASRKLMLKR